MKLLTLLLLLTLNVGLSSINEPRMIVQGCFKNVLENPHWTQEEFDRYFAKNYIQVVDGKFLSYRQVKTHLEALKNVCKSLKIVFHTIVSEGDKVVTHHTAHVIKKDNSQVEMDVLALFTIKDNKISSCWELTHLVKGEKSNKDLGSRH